MKFLLVSENSEIRETIDPFVRNHGGDLIYYRNARKAMDNFEEISPDVVFFNAVDFPRHWKVALHNLREDKNYREAVFILLINEHFHNDEAMKASWLGVNGLVRTDEIHQENFLQFYKIVSRYQDFPMQKIPEDTEGELVFLNPENLRLCSGRLRKIDGTKYRFIPSDVSAVLNISAGSLIEDGSVKWGNNIDRRNFAVLSQNGNLLLEEKTESRIETIPILREQGE